MSQIHSTSLTIWQNIRVKKILLLSLFLSASVTIAANLTNQITIATLSSDFFFIGIPALVFLVSALTIKKVGITTREGKILLPLMAFVFLRWIAEISWIVLEQVLQTIPTPSIADFFWLSGYGSLFLYLLISIKSLKFPVSKKILVFSLVIGFAFFVPSVLVTLNINAEVDAFYLAVQIAYPVADTIILSMALISIIITNNRKNFTIPYLLAAILTLVAVDTAYLTITAFNTSYYTGSIIDFGWTWCYIFLLFGILDYKKNYLLYKDTWINIDKNKNKTISSETVLNFLIPFIGITIVLIASLVTIDHFLVKLERDPNEDLSSVYVFFGALVALSIFVLAINNNLRRVVRKRTEELEAQKNNLENLVSEKTKEVLKSEKLVTIGELSARIAHDLRNPLTVIKNTATLLRLTIPNLDEKTAAYIDRLDAAISRMTHQIDGVMDFVRIRAPQLEESSIHGIMASTTKTMEIPKNIQFVLPQNDMNLLCDQKQFEVVFSNLVSNAIQAIGDKKGTIVIKTYNNLQKNIIEIEDSGPGIPNDVLPKIFEPLFTTKQTGTGLGLVSVKNIVEQHGGTITAKNNPTTFTITLPKIQNLQNVPLTK